ncbi:MAG: CPXCG motif-containing cysteine-rich protein [Blastocatellia bacterium]
MEMYTGRMEIEYEFACPYCWQTITMLLDLSVSRQEYVEDCEICCRPILISYESNGEDLLSFEAQGSM